MNKHYFTKCDIYFSKNKFQAETFKRLYFLFVFILFSQICFAQTYTMNGNPIDDCSGFFYDSGGSSGDYGSNESFSTTICVDGSGGSHIQLLISGVDIASGDLLCFYDGIDATAPQLSCHTDFPPGEAFLAQATAVNSSGCVTVTFTSDGTGEASGWQADINCVTSCQMIEAILISSDPPVNPVDTGYIDICAGDRVFFSGIGSYPQDGAVYNHSDFTSTFAWDFGDGSKSQGLNVNHVYDEPGGYIVQLTITDQLGCTNTNFLSQRVRVSTPPTFANFSNLPDEICAGDTIELSASVGGLNSNYDIGVLPNEGSFPTGGIVSDSINLPDGNGVTYSSSISFTNFSPGQVLSNINDLVQICVVMEHSYMFDLDIDITCPDGSSVVLHNSGLALQEIFLGEPNHNDEGIGATPIPGEGYEYCWTANASNGTWVQYAFANLFDGETLPEGNYSPEDPLTGFLGCPLNGEWTISILDNLIFDNGFIFEWSIEFSPELYPNVETFTPEIVDYGWITNPSIFFQNDDSIAASPQSAGTGNYIFQVEDSFGCTYDTAVSMTVLPPTHPDCFSCPVPDMNLMDANICGGDQLQIDASNTTSLASQEISFESFPNYPIGNSNHPNTNPYEADIDVTSMFPLLITNPSQQICGVCVDLDTDFNADIRLWLQAPSGQLLELSTNNGGGGMNYSNTCFTPNASSSIVGSAAPHTGEFLPEGDWTALTGAAINGTWQLLVSHDFGLQIGELKSWSICFNLENDIEYAWSPALGLSCDDCPDPIASPDATTTYTLNVSDALGCNFTDEMTVTVANNISAPALLSCESQFGGDLELIWDEVDGFSDYEININDTGWIPVNGNLSHLVNGLTNGQEVDFELRVDADNLNCTLESLSASCTYFACNMSLTLTSSGPPSCFNTQDGTAAVSASNGMLPYMYTLNGGTPQALPLFTDIPAGDNMIVVEDGEGCLDTVEFNIASTDPINVDFVIDSVACAGTATGSATAVGTGGVGSFTYTWNTTPLFTFDETITDQEAGEYMVTVTDGNLCQVIETIEIFEPTPLSGTISPTNVSCNEGDDGIALAQPSGGSGPYTYLWSNGATTLENTDLVADTYTVTITDAKLCEFETDILLAEPSGMIIQIDSIDVKCFNALDGEILLSVNGGATPYSFLWNDGSTLEDRNDLGVGVHCVTITDGNGCEKIRCATLEGPTAELTLAISSTPTTCTNNNTDGTTTVTPTGGTGINYQFLWSDDAAQTTGTAQNLVPGNYCVTVTDQNQCSATACVDVVSPPAIVLDSIVGTDVLCFNEGSGTAEVFISGGTGNYTYLWNDPLAQFANPANSLPMGNYEVVVTDEVGCSVSTTISIGQPDLLTATIDITNVNCFLGSDGTATANPIGGTAPFSYLWGPSPFQTTRTADDLSEGGITATVTDANGCNVEVSDIISAPNTAVGVSATQTTIGCFGANESVASAIAAGGTGINYSFEWNTSPISNNAVASGLDAQEYIVTATDENGCEGYDTIIIEQLDEITINMIQVPPSCNGFSDGQVGVNIVTGGVGNGDIENYDFLWENGETNALNANVFAGNYIVTVSDAQGCSNTNTLDLTQPIPITATAIIQDALCFEGDDGEITVEASGSGSSFTYLWDVTANNQDTPTATGLAAGIYAVEITDDTGCTADTLFAVNQPDELTVEFATVNNPCSGDTIGSINSTISGGVPDFIYSWESSDPNNPFTSSAANINSLNAGKYLLTITDANGCSQIDSTIVTSPPSLSAIAEADEVTCFGDSDGFIHVEAQGGVGPFQYSINGESFTYANDFLGLTAGDYTVYIQDANNCTYEIASTVETPEEIIVDLGENFTISYGQAANLVADVSPAGNYVYNWSPTDSLNCEGCLNVFNPSAIGLSNQTTFSVEVVNEFGCSAEDFINVYVTKNRVMLVPTGFSPNGDSNNDLLRTHGKPGTLVTTFKVFDRWGEMVYEHNEPYDINDPTIGWDGSFKGQDLNPGVYVWVAEVEFADGVTDVYKGNTTLIR